MERDARHTKGKAKRRLERKRQVKETDIPKSRQGTGGDGKGSDRKPSLIIYLPKLWRAEPPKITH